LKGHLSFAVEDQDMAAPSKAEAGDTDQAPSLEDEVQVRLDVSAREQGFPDSEALSGRDQVASLEGNRDVFESIMEFLGGNTTPLEGLNETSYDEFTELLANPEKLQEQERELLKQERDVEDGGESTIAPDKVEDKEEVLPSTKCISSVTNPFPDVLTSTSGQSASLAGGENQTEDEGVSKMSQWLDLGAIPSPSPPGNPSSSGEKGELFEACRVHGTTSKLPEAGHMQDVTSDQLPGAGHMQDVNSNKWLEVGHMQAMTSDKLPWDGHMQDMTSNKLPVASHVEGPASSLLSEVHSTISNELYRVNQELMMPSALADLQELQLPGSVEEDLSNGAPDLLSGEGAGKRVGVVGEEVPVKTKSRPKRRSKKGKKQTAEPVVSMGVSDLAEVPPRCVSVYGGLVWGGSSLQLPQVFADAATSQGIIINK